MVMNFLFRNKKGEMVFPPFIFIVLAIVVFGGLILYVGNASTGALVYEQAYAKQVALLINEAKSEMQILVDFEEGVKVAGDKKTELIKVDNKTNQVIVNLGSKSGYSYKYFSDYEVNVYGDPDNNLIIINIKDKVLEKIERGFSFDEDVSEEELKEAVARSEGCEDYSEIISKYAKKYEINPLLILAVIIQESNCNQSKVSSASCVGLMQVCSWEICEDLNLNSSNWEEVLGSDAEKNIQCGAFILNRKYTDYKSGVKESWAYKNKPSFKKAVDDCIKKYPKYEDYDSWNATLRANNGWGCGKGADVDYVEKINKRYALLGGESDVAYG